MGSNDRVEHLKNWRKQLLNPVILNSGFMEEVNENGGFECQCEGAGFCSLYQMEMDEEFHHKCKTEPEVRSMLLEIAWGRQQSKTEESKLRHVEMAKEMAQEQAKLAGDMEKIDQAMQAIEESPDVVEEEGGIGSAIETVLSKFGITTDLVSRVLGSKGCGCDKRKKWLNRIFKTDKDEELFE